MAKLREAIVNLDIEGVKKACEDVIAAGVPAHKAIVDGMSEGMKIVGEKYEDGEYFLADLIMAAETMKEGLAVLEPYLKPTDPRSAGKIVIGTVSGDLHDIGKNILVIFLEAANFDVVDLGVDVPTEEFVEAVRQHSPDIVAISTCARAHMVEIEKIVKDLEEADLRDRIKIIIGGAPITPEYAKRIGADAAGADAAEGVRICKEWTKAE
ncbi:MAG: corrinoid protein [Promethearchaeota archaeon]